MTVESILERIRQKPFRPIALETADKTWIKVNREADIFIYDRMETACVVIFDPKGRLSLILLKQKEHDTPAR